MLPLLLALVSCQDDREDGFRPSPSQDGEVKVPFSVSMPAQLPKTYALDENDENEVKTIDILAFKVNGNEETFAYRAQAEQGSIVDDGSNNKKKFIVTLLKDGSQSYRFVALANAKNELDNTFTGGIVVGTSKDVIMEQLQLTGISKWNVNNGTQGYLPIPMWGETASNIVIQDNTTITDLKLLRMVAKINVKIDSSIAETSFALSSVSLYNYYTAGHIVPDAANLASGSRSTVDKPTVLGTTTKGPIDYAGADIVTTNSIINNIYTFESVVPKNASEVDMGKVTTLVIGGKYNNSSTITYYRVDIANGKNYLDILRNHLYSINITKVKSAGYTSKEDAFNSRAINIEAEVVVWDEASIGNIEFDGQFMLGVSQGKFDFTKGIYTVNSEGNTVSITTDYKSNDGTIQGWKIVSILDAGGNPITDWLKTTVDKGNANTTTNMQLLLTENNSGQARKGYINISAGRLTYLIEVNQSIVPPLSLILKDVNGIEVSELIFVTQDVGVVPVAQQFTASWMPMDRECDLSQVGLSGKPFSFYTGSDTPGQGTFLKTTSNGAGKQTYTIRPAAITQAEVNANPIIEKASKIDFLLTNGVGFVSKTVYLRQIRYGLQPVLSEYYTLDGSQQSIRLKSNSAWKLKSVSDPLDLLISFDMSQNGGYNVTGGDPLLLTLKKVGADVDLTGSSITFTFTDPTGKYDDVAVTINPLSCGAGGVAAPLKIGNGMYLTHKYGTKCWMVENSKEGVPSATTFGGSLGGASSSNASTYKPSNLNGQYYYGDNAAGGCPTGWHLPTQAEATDLRTIVNADVTNNAGKGVAKWWTGTNVTGINSTANNVTLTGGALWYNVGGTSYRWQYWSESGFWWINNKYNLRGISTGTGAMTIETNRGTQAFLSVRCVQD